MYVSTLGCVVEVLALSVLEAMQLGSRMSAVMIAATKPIRNMPDSFIAIKFPCDLDGKRQKEGLSGEGKLRKEE
jgi:hypothetical protein